MPCILADDNHTLTDALGKEVVDFSSILTVVDIKYLSNICIDIEHKMVYEIGHVKKKYMALFTHGVWILSKEVCTLRHT